MAKEQGRKLVAQNKKARHDYHIEDTYEAGLVLDGHRGEVAAARVARRSSTGSPRSTTARRGCTACTSRSTPRAPGPTTRARRKRKLLLNRARDRQDRAQGQRDGATRSCRSSLYFKDGRAKVEIALAKGKKSYDKRHALAERQANREKEQAVGRRLKGIGTEAGDSRAPA